MRFFKISFLFIAIASMTNCASGYQLIAPETINYVSMNETDDVLLQYKYNLLDKKYAKKEVKKGIKLVAIKITNNSEEDIIFGKDALLTYQNGSEIMVMENSKVFNTLKQSPASYLWYLLLTPLNVYSTSSDGDTNSAPVGLVLGPGLAGGNMIAAGSANKKFETEMLEYNINGTLIKKGETKYGLIGIETDTADALTLKLR